MTELRLKQISPGNSITLLVGGLSIALLAAAGCVKKASTVPKPEFNSMMSKMEADPDMRLRELQKESADFTELVHSLPDSSSLEERGKIRQAFGALTQLLPEVQVGPKGGVFSHQVSVVADTQTQLAGTSSDLSAAPIIDRGLRAVYNALDDAQHGGSIYYEDAALRATLDQLTAKINEFDTARGALHDAAWADAFILTSNAISRMTAILSDRLTEGATTVPATTTPTEPVSTPPGVPATTPSEPATTSPAVAPTTAPADATLPPPPTTGPGELGAAAPVTSPTSRPAEDVMERIHGEFSELAGALGGLSPDEQAKETALEKSIAEKIKADPAAIESRSFRDDFMKQFRDVLAADHQTKFDGLMAEDASRRLAILTANHLRQIGLATLLYANDHADQLPPDLGAMVSPSLTADIFLAGGSATQVPPDLATQDAQKQAAWVNEHSDFIYLGAGKLSNKLPGNYVIAYPKAGGNTPNFLLSDGSVQTYTAEQSAKIIAELKAGTNPPTSLPK